MDIFILCY